MIPAAMGSGRAYHLLDEMGETEYEDYDPQMDKMQDWLAGLSVEEWTETLYNSWLYCFQPLLDVPGDGYPAFMTTPSSMPSRRTLSWAERRPRLRRPRLGGTWSRCQSSTRGSPR